MTYTTIDERGPAHRRSGPSCATSPGARPTRPRRPPCGTSTSRPPSPRPSWRTASCPAPTTASRFRRRRRRRPVDIETTRPELLAGLRRPRRPPRRRALPAAVRHRRSRTPLFGVEVPVLAHPLADPEKGTGIAMICTFGDVTDVTWWRELDLPVRAVVGRDGRLLAEPPAGPRRRRRPGAAYAELAGKHRQPGAGSASSSCCGESGDLRRRARPITHPVKFYEKGDRPLEIVTSRQWFIRNGGRDDDLRRGARSSGAASCAGTRPTCRPATRPGSSGLNGDWLISRQRFFGVPFPLWYPVDDRRRRRPRPPARCPTRPRCPSTRPPTSPPGYTRRPARPARRLRRRPRRHGHLGHVVAHPPDRRRLGGRPRPVRPHLPHGPAAPGPRDHPHLAVLHRRPRPLRARLPAVAPTPPSPAGSSTPTARRCRSRRATSSRPSTCSSSTAPTPSATGRPAAGPAPTPPSTRAR